MSLLTSITWWEINDGITDLGINCVNTVNDGYPKVHRNEEKLYNHILMFMS